MHKKKGSTFQMGLLVGILCLSLNLRTSIAAVGPVLQYVEDTFHLSKSLQGLLTTLPLIAFGLASNITPAFTRRFGIGKTLLGAIVVLILGIGVRSSGSLIGLYLGTVLLGIAIAFGNVLIPVVIKTNFPQKVGMVTGLQTGAMALGSTLAAGLSYPLAKKAELGWEGSLGIWAMLGVIAFFIWFLQIKKIKERQEAPRNILKSLTRLSRSLLVWKIAVFMGLQSFTFYVILAWFPAILIDMGYDANYAGNMLSLSQGLNIVGSLIFPYWAARKGDQRMVISVMIFLELLGIIGLMLGIGPVFLWAAFIGLATGGSFAVALLLIILRSSTPEIATDLSGLVQSIGYLIAASGPLAIGLIQDITQTWNYSLGFLLVLGLVKFYAGLESGKNRLI